MLNKLLDIYYHSYLEMLTLENAQNQPENTENRLEFLRGQRQTVYTVLRAEYGAQIASDFVKMQRQAAQHTIDTNL